MIKLKNVTKEFISGDIKTTAVNDVSLTINKGDFISIVGPSGSGKSTLINLICGTSSPSKGTIFYNEYNLAELDKESIARTRLEYLGQVFQDFKLIEHLNVQDNILLPIHLAGKKVNSQMIDKLQSIMQQLGISHRKHHFPNNLSGGEKQRASIARALINDPSYIIADEPTGNLDSQNTEDVIAILTELNLHGKSVIVVTHDEKVASAAKIKLNFKDGRLQP